MAIAELFGVFPVRNAELRSLADFCYECAHNVSEEPSAGLAIGFDEHAIIRFRGWLANAKSRAEALAARPVPDLPTTAKIHLMAQHDEVPSLNSVDGRAVNGDAEALVAMFQTVAYELTHSNSASIGGGLIAPDAKRLTQNLDAVSQFLDSVETSGSEAPVDFPNTAAPEAEATSLSNRNAKR